jgi:RNA recognition motif-containing protein
MRIFLGNLRDMSERELRDLLQPYECSDIEIKYDPSGTSKGFAFAEVEESTRAILDLDGTELNHRRLHVAIARARTEPSRY